VTRFDGILLDSHHESENQNSDMDGLHAENHPQYIKNVNDTLLLWCCHWWHKSRRGNNGCRSELADTPFSVLHRLAMSNHYKVFKAL